MGIRPDSHAALLGIARQGLPRREGRPQRVVIVGAGMAGLVAAWELARAGHEPIVLEARARVGGRVHTLREPFTDGLYAEVGAMRIPRTHDLTLAYCERFGLKLTPFTMNNPQAYVYLRGRRWRLGEVQSTPTCLPFTLADEECGRTVDALWTDAIASFTDRIAREGDAAWAAIVKEWDHCSTREFLEECHWSEGAIEAFGLLQFQEALDELLLPRAPPGGGDARATSTWSRSRAGWTGCRRVRARAPAPHPVRRQDDRPRPGRGLRHRALPDRGRPVPRDRRPRPRHGALRRPAARRDPEAVLPRQAAGHPPAALRRLGEDPPPVPPAVLGGGRRHPGRGHGDRPSRSAPSTIRTTVARRAAGSSWPATPGRRTPSAGAPSRRATGSPRPSRTSRSSTRR